MLEIFIFLQFFGCFFFICVFLVGIWGLYQEIWVVLIVKIYFGRILIQLGGSLEGWLFIDFYGFQQISEGGKCRKKSFGFKEIFILVSKSQFGRIRSWGGIGYFWGRGKFCFWLCLFFRRFWVVGWDLDQMIFKGFFCFEILEVCCILYGIWNLIVEENIFFY